MNVEFIDKDLGKDVVELEEEREHHDLGLGLAPTYLAVNVEEALHARRQQGCAPGALQILTPGPLRGVVLLVHPALSRSEALLLIGAWVVVLLVVLLLLIESLDCPPFLLVARGIVWVVLLIAGLLGPCPCPGPRIPWVRPLSAACREILP